MVSGVDTVKWNASNCDVSGGVRVSGPSVSRLIKWFDWWVDGRRGDVLLTRTVGWFLGKRVVCPLLFAKHKHTHTHTRPCHIKLRWKSVLCCKPCVVYSDVFPQPPLKCGDIRSQQVWPDMVLLSTGLDACGWCFMHFFFLSPTSRIW